MIEIYAALLLAFLLGILILEGIEGVILLMRFVRQRQLHLRGYCGPLDSFVSGED
jgi:hypothetical protein